MKQDLQRCPNFTEDLHGKSWNHQILDQVDREKGSLFGPTMSVVRSFTPRAPMVKTSEHGWLGRAWETVATWLGIVLPNFVQIDFVQMVQPSRLLYCGVKQIREQLDSRKPVGSILWISLWKVAPRTLLKFAERGNSGLGFLGRGYVRIWKFPEIGIPLNHPL